MSFRSGENILNITSFSNKFSSFFIFGSVSWLLDAVQNIKNLATLQAMNIIMRVSNFVVSNLS